MKTAFNALGVRLNELERDLMDQRVKCRSFLIFYFSGRRKEEYRSVHSGQQVPHQGERRASTEGS